MRSSIFILLLVFASSAIAAPVATVGNEPIDSAEISYRLSTEKAYGNSAITDTVALVSLINDAICLRAAESLGIGPTEAELTEFASHAQQTTKAPAVLAKVKALFGNDQVAYNKFYIAPKVTNRKLREHHANTAQIHGSEKSVADDALAQAVSGRPLQEIADETIATVSSFDIPLNGNSSLIAILSGLSVGSIHPEVIENDSSFLIVGLSAKDGEKYTVEALRIQKKSFDEWFQQLTQGMNIQILDEQLKQSIQSEYPGIWWVQTL